MTVFRPCIDLHHGQVKQIVGGSLRDSGPGPKENFISEKPAAFFAELYRQDALPGGHVIKLGPGNDAAALSALQAYPGGLQIGGGINPENAVYWLEQGASHVIVTSYLFEGGEFSQQRLAQLLDVISPEQLVIDLSCRRVGPGWRVATDRWQTITSSNVDSQLLEELSSSCAEFLVHAADVEGLCQGIDEELVSLLGQSSPLPVTYAGGARALEDLARVAELSDGRVDLTFGSALDLFGGEGVRYADCVKYSNRS